MRLSPVRRSLLWSSVLAALLQLTLAGVSAAGTGGGGFPIWGR